MGHYLRAEKILTGPLPPSRMPRLGNNERDGEDAAASLKSKGKGKGRAGLRDFSMMGSFPRGAGIPEDDEDVDDEEDEGQDEDQTWIGDLMRNTKGGLWGALNSLGRAGQARRTGFGQRGAGEALTEWSMPCKYLAALCMVSRRGNHRDSKSALKLELTVRPTIQVHQERFTDALELIGESNPFSATGKSYMAWFFPLDTSNR